MNITLRRPHDTAFSIATWSAIAGAVIWLVGIAILRPVPLDLFWARALLLLAPLVLAPLGLRLATILGNLFDQRRAFSALLPAAMALGAANFLEPGWLAAGLAAPWMALTAYLAVRGLYHLRRGRLLDRRNLCQAVSLVFLAIGAGWATLDRGGIRPLGFDPVIVLLTAIHFHYAGFVLTMVVSLADHGPRRVLNFVACGVLLGVPFVAVGITATQLNASPVFEAITACFLAAIGAVVALLHLNEARRGDLLGRVRLTFLLIGISLLFSMSLAAVYAVRFYFPVAWLDIPWMRALHGTANVFGFAMPALLVRRPGNLAGFTEENR